MHANTNTVHTGIRGLSAEGTAAGSTQIRVSNPSSRAGASPLERAGSRVKQGRYKTSLGILWYQKGRTCWGRKDTRTH